MNNINNRNLRRRYSSSDTRIPQFNNGYRNNLNYNDIYRNNFNNDSYRNNFNNDSYRNNYKEYINYKENIEIDEMIRDDYSPTESNNSVFI